MALRRLLASVDTDTALRAALTDDEWAFVKQQRLGQILNQWMHTISLVASNHHFLGLYGGDPIRFGAHYGSIVSMNNLFNAFLNPIVGSLSDTYGRRWIMTAGRLGWLLWWGILPAVRTPFQRLVGEVLCWGTLGAGNWSVFAAAYADRFGDRPELTAQIHAADEVFGSIGHFTGLFMGNLIGTYLGHSWTWVASAVIAAGLVAVAATTQETLDVDKRKPFTLAKANPLSNLAMLFSNGPGLRALALSTACFQSAQSTWSIVQPWRFGVLGWTPETNSSYKLWLQPPAIAVDKFFVAPFMRYTGNLRCFEWGSLATAIGYYIWGQCYRPVGASPWRHVLQYGLIQVVTINAFAGPRGHAMRAMFVKQGITVADVGKGELNAAYSGLGVITGVVSPLIWGRLYAFFLSDRAKDLPRLLNLGPGGVFTCAGSLNMLSWWIVKRVDRKHLFIDEPGMGIASGGGAKAKAG